ncbi:uncharacterized protein LOC118436102 [Folsomia candida]|uniref:uncharacterized protein LOC118436102 n=1 Tax=Folsomia candida TaxID=158441 RepID=UPI0016053295|nr:uncharacterized protein LOC118436102 [Folsomia candida]
MVSVWAMEQRHRRFESQDVLVPWSRPMNSSSDDKTSSIERDLNSTTTTSDDDAATHYHAYTQTSDSDHSFPSCSVGGRKRGRNRHRGRSIDPICPSSSQSSSDLSSPNESCYTFVRKALQKLAGTRRNRGGRRPWFLQGLDIPMDEDNHHFGSLEEDAVEALEYRNNYGNLPINNFMPIELRQLESSDYAELFQLQGSLDGGMVKTSNSKPPGLLFSNILYPRRRTLETTCELQPSSSSGGTVQPKSKSLSDLFGLIPGGILRSQRKSAEDIENARAEMQLKIQLTGVAAGTRSTSSLSGGFSPTDFPEGVSHKAVQTDMVNSSLESLGDRPDYHFECCGCGESVGNGNNNKLRPVLVKQKQSVCSPSASGDENTGSHNHDHQASVTGAGGDGESSSLCWGEMKKSVRDLPELKRHPSNTLQVPPTTRTGGLGLGSSFWKQSSLNEELIFSERLKEKQLLKQQVQKQSSLNEELIYKQRRENTRWDAMKEAILNSSNVKCLQLIRDGISSRFRSSSNDAGLGGTGQQNGNGSGSGSGGDRSSSEHSCSNSEGHTPSPTNVGYNKYNNQRPCPPPPGPPPSASTSIRNGIVRMLQNWKQGEVVDPRVSNPSLSFGGRRDSTQGPQRATSRGLFPPFFLRRSSAGSLNLSKDHHPMSSSKVLSPPHLLKRRPSENEIVHDGVAGGASNGNKLLPGVRHIRKLSYSKDTGSDSSKDSSFQSDTSVDSEDSFASVIFIPNNKSGGLDGTGQGDSCFTFNAETRANSTDSDRSPKSPASRLSPPNHNSNLPKSPSPLASELLTRRRSPEVSPTKFGAVAGGQGGAMTMMTANSISSRETSPSKFVFDDATTLLSPGPGGSGGYHSSGDGTDLLVVTNREDEHISNNKNLTEEVVRVPRLPFIQTDQIPLLPSRSKSPLLPLLLESPPVTVSTTISSSTFSRKKVERIEVLRKPGVLPEGNKVTRQQVRRSLPKSLAVELFNPETDDADTSDTSSSSPNSVSSVVSVVNEESQPLQLPVPEKEQPSSTTTNNAMPSSNLDDFQPTELTSIMEETIVPSVNKISHQLPPTVEDELQSHAAKQTVPSSSRKSSSSNILEAAANMVSSLEGLVSSSTSSSPPGSRRKLTLAKLGSTSEWLISLPHDFGVTRAGGGSCSGGGGGGSSASSSTSSSGQGPLRKLSSLERRHAAGSSGEKLWVGDVKKYAHKGPDAKWPTSIMDDSPPPSAYINKPEDVTPIPSTSSIPNTSDCAEMTAKLLEEMEEGDSLFDSIENLSTSRQHPSRNPSIDSSVRMSSTCSCSIRGGESFESWSSAKSSLTNSSSTHHPLQPIIPLPPQHMKAFPTIIPLYQPRPSSNNHNNQVQHPSGSGSSSSRMRHQGGHSSKSSYAAGEEDTENSTHLTYHRYYHVFREGELDKLIEKYVQNLHIISSYYDHANWCIIAEKVQVWTI